MTKEQWLEELQQASSTFSVEPASQQYKAISTIQRLLTRDWIYGLPDNSNVIAILEPFYTWLTAQSNSEVLKFLFAVHQPPDYDAPYRQHHPLNELAFRGRLTGDLSPEHIDLAIEFHLESKLIQAWSLDRKEWANWHRDSSLYLEAFTHPSYVVRSVAANAAGASLSSPPPSPPLCMDAISAYLAHPFHHTGTEAVTEPSFGLP